MKYSKLYLTIFVSVVLALTGCNINAEVTPVDKSKEEESPQTATIVKQDPTTNTSNTNNPKESKATNNKAPSKVPTQLEGEELEPHIQIGEVTNTEMDAAYFTLVKITHIPESIKVKGKWNAYVGNIQSTYYDCHEMVESQKVCGIAFPTSKFKPGNKYMLTVEFEGKVGSREAYLKETKSFIAPKPYE